MQAQARRPDLYTPQTTGEWHLIRGTGARRRKARIRRWTRLYERSAAGMYTFGVLFFLAWLTVSITAPQNHLLPGILLLVLLLAEAASVILYMISDAVLTYLRGR